MRSAAAALFVLLGAVAACSAFGGSDDGGGGGGQADADVDGAPRAPDGDVGPDAIAPSIACDAGAPPQEIVATANEDVTAMASDGVYVFWTSQPTKVIARARISGADAGVEEPLGSVQNVSGLALSANELFFRGSDAVRGDVLHSVRKDGTNLIPLSSGDTPSSIVATAQRAFFAKEKGLWSAAENAASVEAWVYTDTITRPIAIAQGGGRVAFVVLDPVDAAAGLGLFVASAISSAVQPQVVTPVDPSTSAVATDGTTFIWASGSKIYAMQQGGSIRTLRNGTTAVSGLVYDPPTVFFTAANGIFAVSDQGGCEALVTDTITSVISVTPQHVYFVRSPRQIVRVAR